MTSSIFFINGL